MGMGMGSSRRINSAVLGVAPHCFDELQCNTHQRRPRYKRHRNSQILIATARRKREKGRERERESILSSFQITATATHSLESSDHQPCS
jgi:hypothetical protein